MYEISDLTSEMHRIYNAKLYLSHVKNIEVFTKEKMK